MTCHDVGLNILCFFFPWWALGSSKGWSDNRTWICLFLWLFAWPVGIIYGYVMLNKPGCCGQEYEKANDKEEGEYQNQKSKKSKKRKKNKNRPEEITVEVNNK